MKGGEGVLENLRFYLRKTKGGRGSGAVFPKRKQKELEVFPYGPLAESLVSSLIASSLAIMSDHYLKIN